MGEIWFMYYASRPKYGIEYVMREKYPLDRKLVRPQSRSEFCGDREIFCPSRKSNSASSSLLNTPTKLFRLKCDTPEVVRRMGYWGVPKKL
jgi:hypothetical protein